MFEELVVAGSIAEMECVQFTLIGSMQQLVEGVEVAFTGLLVHHARLECRFRVESVVKSRENMSGLHCIQYGVGNHD